MTCPQRQIQGVSRARCRESEQCGSKWCNNKIYFYPINAFGSAARKVTTLSNVPPFIKDDLLLAELTRHGFSNKKKNPLSCKSPLLKHVVCL